MTNREKLTEFLQVSKYSNAVIADILSDICEECGIPAYLDRNNIEKWLGLECDKDNNWGELYVDENEE